MRKIPLKSDQILSLLGARLLAVLTHIFEKYVPIKKVWFILKKFAKLMHQNVCPELFLNGGFEIL